MNRPDTIQELAALIPADQAQRIVARALKAFGAREEWDSETIEWVAEPFEPLARALAEHGVPNPFVSEYVPGRDPWREEDEYGYSPSEAYWQGLS